MHLPLILQLLATGLFTMVAMAQEVLNIPDVAQSVLSDIEAQLPTVPVEQATSMVLAQATIVPGADTVLQETGDVPNAVKAAVDDILAQGADILTAVTDNTNLRHRRRGYRRADHGNHKRGADLGKNFEDLPFQKM